MAKNSKSIRLNGTISLEISNDDPLLWKAAMLIEAASSKEKTIVQIAEEYGYTREYFYQVLAKFNNEGSAGLQNKMAGPKRNYKRTTQITKQIILHRFLDPEANCEVIAQKMRQTGFNISQRSVERTITEYGLQKKGYIKQIQKMKK